MTVRLACGFSAGWIHAGRACGACQSAQALPAPRAAAPAGTFDECSCNATNPLLCAANNCTSAIYVGHRGSDKPG